VLVNTLYIISISSVYIIINIINFKEDIKALILKPLYLINKRVLNRCNLIVIGISITLEAYKNQDYNIDFKLL
jgi:hypothetical protein